jgi:hypothetical protein
MPRRLADDDDTVVISTFRVPRAVLEKFDRWVEEQNEGRRGPRLARVDVLRGLMDWAADERPAWEERAPARGHAKPAGGEGERPKARKGARR